MEGDWLIFNAISPTILLVITGPDSVPLLGWSPPHRGYIFPDTITPSPVMYETQMMWLWMDGCAAMRAVPSPDQTSIGTFNLGPNPTSAPIWFALGICRKPDLCSATSPHHNCLWLTIIWFYEKITSRKSLVSRQELQKVCELRQTRVSCPAGHGWLMVMTSCMVQKTTCHGLDRTLNAARTTWDICMCIV